MVEKNNYAWPVTSINREDYEEFCKWFEHSKDILQENQVAIWGAGIRGTEFSIFFKRLGYNNLVFVDSNAQKWGGYIDEFEIISPEELEAQRENKKRVILISTENSAGIERELEAKKCEKEHIMVPFAPHCIPDWFKMQAYSEFADLAEV